eukprot:2389861-Amphidinium_carterae.1
MDPATWPDHFRAIKRVEYACVSDILPVLRQFAQLGAPVVVEAPLCWSTLAHLNRRGILNVCPPQKGEKPKKHENMSY